LFAIRRAGLQRRALYGLIANIGGIIAVATSIDKMGEYLSIPGVALATFGMILMCSPRWFQRDP
jgi:hypothetical protein